MAQIRYYVFGFNSLLVKTDKYVTKLWNLVEDSRNAWSVIKLLVVDNDGLIDFDKKKKKNTVLKCSVMGWRNLGSILFFPVTVSRKNIGFG